MDYFKLITAMQKKFIKNPRQGIINFLNNEEQAMTNLSKLKLSLNNLIIFKEVHKEYASIIGKLMEANVLDLSKLLDHYDMVATIQRSNEWVAVLNSYKAETNEITAIRLGRAYASSMELVWKKLKRLISIANLNPKNKYLNIPMLLKKLEQIEKEYNVTLPTIKEYINGKLRNFVGHESCIFIPPNIISFLDTKGGKSKKVGKATTEEIYEMLLAAMAILTAFSTIENAALAARLEPLLKLTDDELHEYVTTGILTAEMRNKMVRVA